MNLIDLNDTKIKSLANIGVQDWDTVVSHPDDWSQTFCWIRSSDTEQNYCECAQFELSGNEYWKNHTECDRNNNLFYVNDLSEGGIIFLSHEGNNKFNIIEMRPYQETFKSTHEIEWDKDIKKVMINNDFDCDLTIFWKQSKQSTGGEAENLFITKYPFPSKCKDSLLHN